MNAGFGSSGKDDDTPFDGSGLKLKTTKTRRELNEVEFASILRVTEKYLLTKPSRKIAPFNFDWLLALHREMLGSIWSWAGEIRSTEKNIGVSPNIIAAELGVIAMEADKRHNETGALVIASAAEFHHRAVWVHPFEDGNGRWARLLANVWLMQHDQPCSKKRRRHSSDRTPLGLAAILHGVRRGFCNPPASLAKRTLLNAFVLGPRLNLRSGRYFV